MAQYRHLINNILSFPLPELLLPLNNTIMSLLDCPPEIIDHIISFVPVWDTPPTYGTLSLICRSLRDAGQKHIFRKVSLQMNAPPNTKNRFLGCTGNTKNAETEHPLPPSFLRLHQVLKANPTLSGHVSTLWIHTHMRNPANPFWMSDTDSEDAAIAIWVDILALISGRSLSITAFEMTTTQTPSSWNRINQDIRSKIVEIWCKPTMKRIYMNSIEDLPRNLFGLRGMCAEKVYLWHFSLGSDFGEKRDDRNPNGEDQIVPGNKGPGIISLLVGFDSDEWLSTFISAILLHPSNAASLRGTSSLNLVVQLNADLPETISVSLLPSFPSLKDLTLQWTSSLSASGTGQFSPLNLALLPNLQTIHIVFPSRSYGEPAPANFLNGTFKSLLQPSSTSAALQSPSATCSSFPPPTTKLDSISIFWVPHPDLHSSFVVLSNTLEAVYRQSKGALQWITFEMDKPRTTKETKEALKHRICEALSWGMKTRNVGSVVSVFFR